jgi:hypothetical protein
MNNDNSYKPWLDPKDLLGSEQTSRIEDCVLRKPMLLYIPPGGTDIYCPACGKNHRVYGQEITC